MTKDMQGWLKDAPGRAFLTAKIELEQAGYVQVKSVRNRSTKNTVVSFRKVERGEDPAYTIELEHDWIFNGYGIGKPGKVVRTSEMSGGTRNDYT